MSRAGGCVYRRGNIYWVKVELDPDPLTGERRYHYKGGFATKKEADAYRVQVLSELQRGSFTAPAKLTLREYAARWLEAVKPNLEFNSWQAYEMNLRVRILPHLGNIELAKLQPLALQELYARLLKQGLSPRSVVYVHRTLHRMLEMAVKWGMVGRNVADAVEPPKQERKEMRVLDEDQAGVLLDGISDLRLKTAVALALGCGLRRSEICGLRWEDVDLGAGRLYLAQTVKRVKGEGLKARPTKTHRSRRPVDMPSGVAVALKAWRKQQAAEKLAAGPLWEESGLVLTTERGTAVDGNWITKNFARKLKALGLPQVRFHDLRHTQATLLLKKGVHPKVVQERLGHSSINITMDTYSHVLPGMQREAAQVLDSLFTGAARKEHA